MLIDTSYAYQFELIQAVGVGMLLGVPFLFVLKFRLLRGAKLYYKWGACCLFLGFWYWFGFLDLYVIKYTGCYHNAILGLQDQEEAVTILHNADSHRLSFLLGISEWLPAHENPSEDRKIGHATMNVVFASREENHEIRIFMIQEKDIWRLEDFEVLK